MTYCFSDIAAAVRSSGEIGPELVLAARRQAWGDGAISPQEAEAIFELNRLAAAPSPEWTDFFVEALVQYVVNTQPPQGYVDEANAAWLMAHIDHDGRLDTMAELELLVKLLETALNAPASLKSYALAQIERAVLTGSGPTRRGGDMRPGRIDEAEAQLLRRIVFASGGEGALAVTRDEAEMLWRLKDATHGSDNAADWPRLFVQAVGSHLMAYHSYQPLDRGEAARLEAFADDRSSSVRSFFGRMAKSVPAGGFRQAFEAPARTDHAAAAEHARSISPEEAEWLQGKIDADGALDPLEQALLDFVAEESGWRP